GRWPLVRQGRVLLRRVEPAERPDHATQSALDGRSDSLVCGRNVGIRITGPASRICEPVEMVSQLSPGPGEIGVALGRTWHEAATPSLAAPRSPHEMSIAPDAR